MEVRSGADAPAAHGGPHAPLGPFSRPCPAEEDGDRVAVVGPGRPASIAPPELPKEVALLQPPQEGSAPGQRFWGLLAKGSGRSRAGLASASAATGRGGGERRGGAAHPARVVRSLPDRGRSLPLGAVGRKKMKLFCEASQL